MKHRELAILLLIAIAALLVHGYHPAAEDGEIYLPAIKKALHPSLYPFGSEFFTSQTHLTFFPQVIAASIRISHLPFDWAILLWHIGCIFIVLAADWRIAKRCFADRLAPLGGTVLVAALLTLPVAGTSLYLMDQYLSTRDLSTAFTMLMVANTIERRFVRVSLWTGLVALIHPLMAGFGVAFVGIWLVAERWPALLRLRRKAAQAGAGLLFLPLAFGRISPDYREALSTRPFLFILRWHWYEWVGIFAPVALLWLLKQYARRNQLRNLEVLSRALIWFTAVFFIAALVITVPQGLMGLVILQPMRSLQLVYVLLFVLLGGWMTETILKQRIWRWLVLFVPLSLAMFLVQRELFPASPHVEFPGITPRNPWREAFAWIRAATPQDAIFALDPEHMNQAAEDKQGFRALAERSRLADNVKDGAPVTVAPALAPIWREQLRAQQGWKEFQAGDFRRLRQQYGVSWVVVASPVAGLVCPYENPTLAVCRVE